MKPVKELNPYLTQGPLGARIYSVIYMSAKQYSYMLIALLDFKC